MILSESSFPCSDEFIPSSYPLPLTECSHILVNTAGILYVK